MIKATLTRTYYHDITRGMIRFEGVEHDAIFTLEPPWLDNQKNKSCIPEGIYECVTHIGRKPGYMVKDVPGRTAIKFHVGNWLLNPYTQKLETEGCILCGMGAGKLAGVNAVMNSKGAMAQIRGMAGHKFMLEVKS